ncbi:MAG: hypothetical protein ACREU7_12450 [Burkholderiales bacterium]
MLTVTKAALERLSRKLARRKAADDVALRFKRAEGRWRLRIDRLRPGDASFSHEGRTVLLLDEFASEAMATMTLGIRKTETGPRLKLRRAASTAG